MSQSKPKELTDCPDWGKGGSYTVDPKTGKRTLVERTAPAGDATAAPPAAEEAAPASANLTKGT